MLTPQVKNTIQSVLKDIVVKGHEAVLVVKANELISKDEPIPEELKKFLSAALNNISIKGEFAALIVEAQQAITSV